MGTCLSNNDKRNQIKIKDSELKEIDRYLNKATRSLCKIITEKNKGTGFFIKLYRNNNPLFCLMTNEHVIKKGFIDRKETIEIIYDFEFNSIKIKLDKEERFINEYTDMNIDLTIVEIIKKDNISEDFFLLPYTEYNNIKKGNEIYIPQYIKKLKYAEGKIEEINNYELSYKISTTGGSSGSPIILKNTIQVIGIHKEGGENENYGNFIYPIIEKFKSENNSEKKICENGKYYTGYWENGISHGKGILLDENKKIRYEGDCINGNIEGYGKYYFEGGGIYIGQFKNDLQYGKGKVYGRNGNLRYDGDFVNNHMEGMGKYIYKNGEYYYGQWKNNLRNGKGIMYYKNGNKKYDGDFINNKYEGNGTYFWENGEYYIGQWKNGLKHGKGTIYYKNGNIKYDGNFINGKYG